MLFSFFDIQNIFYQASIPLAKYCKMYEIFDNIIETYILH